MEEAQPCHFLQFANLHRAAANPGPGHGSMALPTRRDGRALPGPGGVPAQGRQGCSSCIRARKSQVSSTVGFFIFF